MHRTVAAQDGLDGWGRAHKGTLLEAARPDPAAVGELYCRYAERIFRYLLTYTENEEEAADLTQQVFLRAMQALPTHRRRDAPLIAWLSRIARNAATDAFRRRRRSVPWDAIPESLQPVLDEDPARFILKQETFNHLGMLIAALPTDRQDLLALRFAAGLTIPEIAHVLGDSEAAIQKRLWRTLRILRERYDDEAG